MIGAHIILYLISRRMPKRNDCGDSFTFDVFKQSRTQEGSYEKSVGLEGMAYLSTSLSLAAFILRAMPTFGSRDHNFGWITR